MGVTVCSACWEFRQQLGSKYHGPRSPRYCGHDAGGYMVAILGLYISIANHQPRFLNGTFNSTDPRHCSVHDPLQSTCFLNAVNTDGFYESSPIVVRCTRV